MYNERFSHMNKTLRHYISFSGAKVQMVQEKMNLSQFTCLQPHFYLIITVPRILAYELENDDEQHFN